MSWGAHTPAWFTVLPSGLPRCAQNQVSMVSRSTDLISPPSVSAGTTGGTMTKILMEHDRAIGESIPLPRITLAFTLDGSTVSGKMKRRDLPKGLAKRICLGALDWYEPCLE